jgi:hypothetical protein
MRAGEVGTSPFVVAPAAAHGADLFESLPTDKKARTVLYPVAIVRALLFEGS